MIIYSSVLLFRFSCVIYWFCFWYIWLASTFLDSVCKSHLSATWPYVSSFQICSFLQCLFLFILPNFFPFSVVISYTRCYPNFLKFVLCARTDTTSTPNAASSSIVYPLWVNTPSGFDLSRCVCYWQAVFHCHFCLWLQFCNDRPVWENSVYISSFFSKLGKPAVEYTQG